MLVRRIVVLLVAAAAFCLVAAVPWHADAPIRRATAIAMATLILWISEVAPLGIVALWIPIAATATGILTWKQALSSWGDEIVFQFLGAFLLARALDKHGAFDWVGRLRITNHTGPLIPALLVMAISGAISTMQNNTAVAAMLLPATIAIARLTKMPALPMLALSYGATFGGMATPVGTAPNFIGYRAMSAIDPSVSFLSWMSVGVPVWIGVTLLGWGVLTLVDRLAADPARGMGRWLGRSSAVSTPQLEDVTEVDSDPIATSSGRSARVAAWVVFGLAAATWLTIGVCKSTLPTESPAIVWIDRYIPDSLVPIAAAILLFLWPAGPQRRPVLEADDLNTLDWDTLFLIAGGLCLGLTLSQSGAAKALAGAVASLHLSQVWVMLAIGGGATVLLSELTSNTATAGLMVPIAASLAPAVGLPGTTVIWLVALCASLGFALPVSTPPNAIVYGTRMIPLRLMIFAGLLIDVLGLVWIVACLRFLG